MHQSRFVAAMWAVGWLASGAARAAAPEVEIPSKGQSFATLRAAVAAATEGDVLVMSPGEFHEDGAVTVSKSITIRGGGQDVTILTATDTTSSVVLVDTAGLTLTLEDMSIVAGSDQRGVLATADSNTLTIRSTTFRTGVGITSNGGAISAENPAALTLENVNFLGDGNLLAKSGGGIYVTSNQPAEMQLTDVVFDTVKANEYGGGIYAQGVNLTCTRCAFTSGYASQGAALYLVDATAWIQQSTFCDLDGSKGPALYGIGANTVVTLVSSIVGSNPSGASAVLATGGYWYVANNNFVQNQGSGIEHPDGLEVVIENNVFLDNGGFGIVSQNPDAVFNWFEGNGFGATNGYLDPTTNLVDVVGHKPLFVSDKISCTDPLSMFPAPGSPLIDAGVPIIKDLDGTTSDIGAFGGPYADPTTVDADGDGYSYAVDCNDMDPNFSPDSVEVCDGVDNDCDSLVDDADPFTEGRTWYFPDCDGDGQGSQGNGKLSCTTPEDEVCGVGVPVTWVAEDQPFANADCDDTDPTLFTTLWRPDRDGDGFSDANTEAVPSCGEPATDWINTDNGLDCDDAHALVNPDAVEVRNKVDDNCDGQVDEGEKGCRCASSGPPSPALALFGLLVPALRRRRSR